jgi:hypothetical protein
MMNEQYLLENLVEECNQLDEEYMKLNQEVQEIYDNSNVQNDNVMFNPYPTPTEAPLDIVENILNSLSSYNGLPDGNQPLMSMNQNSSTFDPISVFNGQTEDTNVGSGMNDEELINMVMANLVENAPLGNVCNDVDFDVLSQNLLSMQENSVNNSIPMDASIESIIDHFKNNSVSFLETTYGNKLSDQPLEELLPMENIVSKTQMHTMLYNENPI